MQLPNYFPFRLSMFIFGSFSIFRCSCSICRAGGECAVHVLDVLASSIFTDNYLDIHIHMLTCGAHGMREPYALKLKGALYLVR